MSDLPRDPDADALPPALALALDVHGDEPVWIMDPATGDRTPITRADLAGAYGDRRRLEENGE